ncbi:FUSC family protein [Cellulomonas massiliensis]|uniref:FUSC family protein n=1 Tax=Cellulomonas massiliensis TaxID=1465811 RepID=UPI00031533D6|nr:FUSC family protein [Cellulomonas massiliensis]
MGLLGGLLAFGPHAGAHRVALRASVSVLVPLLVLWGTGHLEWSIYAAFGAFTSLYGRERTDRARLALQVEAGVTQVVVVTLGVLVALLDARAWLAVPVAALLAAGVSAGSAIRGWHPPGALFQVFAFATVAAAPATPADLLPAVLVSAASALLAVLVGSVGPAVRRVRGVTAEGPGRPIGGAVEGLARYAAQSGAGVLLAGTIATAAGIGRPYWAMVSAVVPLVARDLGAQLTRGLHRVVGTGLGLLVAWALLALDVQGLVLVLVVAVLQAAAELFVGRNYAFALVFVTPLALLMVHLVLPVPTRELLADRGIETLIGVVVGIAVGYVSRPGAAEVIRARLSSPAA